MGYSPCGCKESDRTAYLSQIGTSSWNSQVRGRHVLVSEHLVEHLVKHRPPTYPPRAWEYLAYFPLGHSHARPRLGCGQRGLGSPLPLFPSHHPAYLASLAVPSVCVWPWLLVFRVVVSVRGRPWWLVPRLWNSMSTPSSSLGNPGPAGPVCQAPGKHRREGETG